MSVLKNLKSIFIVEEDKGKEETPASTPKSGKKDQPAVKPPKPEAPVEHVRSSVKEGKRDNKIIETLFTALEKSNLGGFDYIEFKQSVKGLEKMVVDEATRFKSAFATASTMGVTLDKLVETANYYVKVLDKERNEFVKAAGDQTTAMVENRKREIQQLQEAMAEKKAMIEKLTKELSSSEQKLKTIQKGIDSASVKIEQTKKNFDVSFNYLRQQITVDIEKMKNYLK